MPRPVRHRCFGCRSVTTVDLVRAEATVRVDGVDCIVRVEHALHIDVTKAVEGQEPPAPVVRWNCPHCNREQVRRAPVGAKASA